jgi:toxin ParE1/3/4
VAAAVLFSRHAIQDLTNRFQYIKRYAGVYVARHEVARVFSFCKGLSTFPERGIRRDDVRQGIRPATFGGRYTIVYDWDSLTVTIIRIVGRGQRVAL